MTYTTQIIARYLQNDESDSAAVYQMYALTTDHATSSYGVPVLVGPDGTTYGHMDILPNGETADMATFVANWDSDEAVAAVNKFRGV